MNDGEEVITGQVLRTTDCACLNTVTDSDDDFVDTGSIVPGTGSSTSGSSSSSGGNTGSISTGSTGTTTTTTTSGGSSSGGITTASTSVGATSGNPVAKASYMSKDELLLSLIHI